MWVDRVGSIGLCVLLPWCVACGSEPGVKSDAASQDDLDASRDKPDRKNEPVAPQPEPEPECEVPQFTDDSEAQAFEELRGSVVDDAGKAVAGITAQTCGTNLCLQGETDDTGYVLHQRAIALRRPAFKYGDGLRYAQFAFLLPDQPVIDVGEQTTVPLLTGKGGDRLEVGAEMTSRGVTLSIAADAQLSLNLLDFPDEADHVFTAYEMPRAVWPDAVADQYDLERVVALGPLKTEICPPAEVRLPNSEGWEPDTEVEILLHVTDVAHHWALYGEWGQVADAVVSEDGAEVVTIDGTGVGQLGVIGLRRSSGR